MAVLILLFVVLLQLAIYQLLIKKLIAAWGVSQAEVAAAMVGDQENLKIISTRAITINASQSDVWQWLMQLGADRCGFYSYDFIEHALGYITRSQGEVKAEFNQLQVGDWVRGSIDERRSLVPYNFKVLQLKPQDYLVLEGWGTFLLKQLSLNKTRLVIRTREPKSESFKAKLISCIMLPLHFIMERGTLLGIKARSEAGAGVKFSQFSNVAWFLGAVLFAALTIVCIVIGHGLIPSFVLSVIFPFYGCLHFLFLNRLPFAA